MAGKPRNYTIVDDIAQMKANLGDIQLLLGVSKSEVKRLVDESIIKKDLRGTYDLLHSLKGYIGYLQVRSGGTKGVSADYQEERARLTKAQADKAEMDAALMAGKLVDIDQLSTEWETMLMSMKAKLIAIPSKVAPLVADEDNPGIIQAMIDDYMREALQELAQYGNGTGASEARSVEGDEGAEPTPETDSKPVGRPRKTARRTVKQ
jgi:phage terminase Nu1 subunit (DNA packaging protein)